MLRETMFLAEFDELIRQPENADRRFELINGEMVEKMPTQLPSAIVQALAGFFFLFLRANPIGRAYPEARYQIPGDRHNAHIPDYSFVLGMEHPIIADGAAPYMPDLAVEVQSPDDSPEKLRGKASYYLANGSRLVWLFFPRERVIEVWTGDGQQRLTIDDTLDGGSLLPGFEVAVRDLFPI